MAGMQRGQEGLRSFLPTGGPLSKGFLMAYYHEPLTLRASSSAFAWGTLIFTDYNSGCLRKILIQSTGYETVIDPKYPLVGKLNEDRHAAKITSYYREVPFQRAVGYGPIQLRGHADFVHVDADGTQYMVDELKSVTSKNVLKNTIKNGSYKTENLAQLVCYMTAFKVTQGRLIYTWYQQDAAGEWRDGEERIFKVDVDNFGRIFVDSKPSQYTVFDLYSHQLQAAKAVYDNHVLQRPVRWDAPFGSPCGPCKFKDACDAWDQGEIEGTDAFVKIATGKNENDPA